MTIQAVRKAFAYKGPRGRSRAEIRAAAELCRAAQGLAFAIVRLVPKGHNQDLAIARLKNSMTSTAGGELMITSATQPPGPDPSEWERGKDPWHKDAFPAEFKDAAPRQDQRGSGWFQLDHWGNAIGFVLDGTEVPIPKIGASSGQIFLIAREGN